MRLRPLGLLSSREHASRRYRDSSTHIADTPCPAGGEAEASTRRYPEPLLALDRDLLKVTPHGEGQLALALPEPG